MNKDIDEICKIGQGADCCKYLTIGGKGFECAKVDAKWKSIVDKAWAENEHVAQGDNCEGKENLSK